MAHQVVELFPSDELNENEVNADGNEKDGVEKKTDKPSRKKFIVPDPEIKEILQVEPENILVDYYPRDQVNTKRVNFFVEFLEYDEKLPAIKLVEENGLYYLIDGMHRVTASKKKKLKTIEAEILNLDRSLWAPYAAYYNTGGSLQLDTNEVKNHIWKVFNDGKLTNQQIGGFVHRSESSVSRYTKDRSDQEKLMAARLCWQLKNDGNSIRKIEAQTGIARSTIQRYIKEEADRIKEAEQKEIERQERAVRAQEKAKQKALEKAKRFERENDQCIELPGENDAIDDLDGALSALSQISTDTETIDDIEYQSLVEGIEAPLLDSLSPSQLEYSQEQPGEDREYTFDTGLGVISGFEKFFGSLKKNDKAILYTFHHIIKDVAAEEISNFIGCPREWVLNTAVALLHFYHYKEISVEEVSVTLSINQDRVKFIKFLTESFSSILPERKNLFSWINTNMPKYRDDRYIQITRREKLYWYCKRENRPVPWESNEDSLCYDIPKEIADNSEKIFQFLLDLQIGISDMKLNKLQAQELLEKFNRITVIVNQVTRHLSDNAHRED